MIFAIDVPHSKAISIVFISLKSMVLGLILIIKAQNLNDNYSDKDTTYPQCSEAYISYLKILQILFILGIIVDTITLIYFYISKQFKKIEYYLFFIFHLVVSLYVLFSGIDKNYQFTQCNVAKALQSGLFSSSLVLQANIFVAMLFNLFIVLKFLHFGSNFVWIFIWIFLGKCNRVDLTIVAMIHTILSVFNIISLLIYRWKGKFTSIVYFIRSLCVISLFAMILCYIIILIGLSSQSKCQNSDFMERTYKAYGWIEILSPLLILIFMRNENGDPREKLVKRHNDVFTKLNQNQQESKAAQI